MQREDPMKSTRLLLSVAAVSAGLIVSGGAQAEDWKPVGQFGWSSVGKSYEIEKGHSYWVGEYSGTFFNDKGEQNLLDHAGVKCPAWGDFDLNNKKIKEGGVCIMTDLDGDRAYATFQGAGIPSHTKGTWEWTGGTGKYKEIKGSNTYAGSLSVNWVDGTASGYATWNR
jgi:hypothetical protein